MEIIIITSSMQRKRQKSESGMCQVQGLLSHCHITVLPSRRFDPFIPLEPGILQKRSGGINSWPRQTVKVQASANVQSSFLRLLYGNLPKITGTIKRGNVCRVYANTLGVFCAGWVEKVKKQERCVCNEKGKRKVISQ